MRHPINHGSLFTAQSEFQEYHDVLARQEKLEFVLEGKGIFSTNYHLRYHWPVEFERRGLHVEQQKEKENPKASHRNARIQAGNGYIALRSRT